MKTTTTFVKKPLVVAIGTAIAGASPMAIAQSADTDSGLFEEIIVTATARESSVQDIPYNISAMSGSAIEQLNIVNQYDLLRSMHGISVIDRGYRNAGTVNSIVIRGLNVENGANGDIQLNAVPTVATYVDNTPMFGNFILKDIQRVEVLRGPQGTLYGSGSLGGTVRYISNKPNPEEFEAKISLDYGQVSGSDGNDLAADVMLNVPLSDNAAFRLSASKIDNDGVIDYVNAYQLNSFGEPLIDVGGTCTDPRQASDNDKLFGEGCFEEVKDADTVEIDYVRAAFRFEPTDNFGVQLAFQRQDDDIGARRAITLGDNSGNGQVLPGDPLYFSYGDDDSGQVLLEPSSREVELLALDLEFDFGFATFTSNTSAMTHVGEGASDNGGLWATGRNDWNELLYGGEWPRPAQRAERGYDDDVFIQEFRLVSNEREGNIDWLVGAFYLDQDVDVWQLSYNPGMQVFNDACRATGDVICTTGGIYGGFWPRDFADLTEIDLDYKRSIQYEELAIYGELTYHVSDTFRLTGGFRWFDDKTVNNSHLGYPLVVGWTVNPSPEETISNDDTLFKLNASWDLADDKMLYATYSEGYRHGGAQAVPDGDAIPPDNFGEPNASAIRTFEADTVTNYEIGLKGTTDNMSYTVSAFHVDWDNPQLNTVTAIYSFYIADNGDKASTQGIEAEVEGYFNDRFHYRVGYTYVKAELDKDFMSTQTGSLIAESGSQLPGAPSSVLSINLDKSWEISGDKDLTVGLNGYYQGDSENFITSDSYLSEKFGSFWLMGANATLAAENWSAMLYIKNLADESGASGSFPCTYFCSDSGFFENWYGNGNRQFIVQPRTIGLRFNYSF
jgi:outer membrane receptor protein involved in Fe transport